MADLEKLATGIRRSRRNLIKVGAVGSAAIFASLTNTRPSQGDDNCLGNEDDRCTKCFLKGTNIQTANGDRKIEDLAVGDLLPTVFRGLCPVQWIGYYRQKKSDQATPWVKDVLPVRVARSALSPGVPHADLFVTKAHALFIDGVLVSVGDLINGTTITLYDARERDELEFFHIKLERHNVIYAEGAPCETVMNVDENAINFDRYLHHCGPPTTQEAPCASLLSFNGGRNEIKSRFRSALSPWNDRRQKLDIIRDGLEERGIALLRQPELMS
jgi:hypothetical protein